MDVAAYLADEAVIEHLPRESSGMDRRIAAVAARAAVNAVFRGCLNAADVQNRMPMARAAAREAVENVAAERAAHPA